jgi:hypothetical protein
MLATDPKFPSAPIPGENWTSDTRNYPWHRPPDITNYDEALEYVVDHFNTSDEGLQYMAFLESGASVAAVTDMLLTVGIADGKWSIDFAILLAGPVSRIIEIAAKMYGINADLGVDMPPEFMTPEKLARDMMKKPVTEEEVQGVDEEAPVEEPMPEEQDTGGFMAMPADVEQAMMLGEDLPADDTEEEVVQ